MASDEPAAGRRDGGPRAPGALAITGGRVVLPSGVADDVAVVCRDGRVAEVVPTARLDPAIPAVGVGGRLVTPGFIDLHTHGALGEIFNRPDPDGYDRILAYQARHGVTAVQASLVSASLEDIDACLAFIAEHRRRPAAGARLLGAHLEGPFLSAAQCGAHDPRLLRPPGHADRLLAHGDALTMVTLAPELPGAAGLTRRLAGAGVVVAAGHSEAGGADLEAVVEAGLSHLTHLWSGQSALVRRGPWRVPGLLEESLSSDTLTAEVIADGRHLPPELLTIARRCLGDRLCVVSDATPGAGLPDGARYRLGTVTCVVRDGVGVVEGADAFGGGVTPLDAMAAHLTGTLGWPVAEVVAMVTETPARVLGLTGRKGAIAPGHDADIAVFDPGFRTWATLVGGSWVHPPAGPVALART